jgi:multidrug efflux pump subunit AcrA (membrane-fusion protein)
MIHRPANGRSVLAFLLFALSAIVLSGCDQQSTTGQSTAAPKNVLVTKVRADDVPVQIHEFGRVVSPESVNIQPQVSGRITEVHFVEGQDVKKGDLLFVIDPRPFQAQLEQSEAQLISDTAQLELNQRNLERDENFPINHPLCYARTVSLSRSDPGMDL